MTKVWVSTRHSGRKPKAYHTNPDCHYLEKTKAVKRVSQEALHDDLEECRNCQGSADYGGWSGHDSLAVELRNNPETRAEFIEKMEKDD